MSNPFFESQKHQPWAMNPTELEKFLAQLGTLPISAVLDVEMKAPVPAMVISGTTATIPVRGTLMKNVPAWLRFFGVDATSYLDIRQQLVEATANPDVSEIRLHIESPGGTVSGCQETAESIAAAAKVKTVTAVIEDLCCSAAYYLASQASTIQSNQSAWVGSIGTFTYFYDYSKLAENEGIKCVLISSGPHKGMGVPGSKITDEQIAGIQEIIDAHAADFAAAVKSGRGLTADAVKTIATGQVWTAAKAKELGLIDEIMNQPKTKIQSGESSMSDKTNETQTVTVDVDKVKAEAAASASAESAKRMADLKAAFPNDLAFAVEQFEKGSTVDQAKAAYCDVLAQKNAELAEQLEKKQTGSGRGTDGVEPIAHGGDGADAGESGGDFVAVAAQLAREKKMKLADAMSQLASEQPALYNAYLAKCRNRQVKDTD